MTDLVDPRHEQQVEHLFHRAEVVLGFSGFTLKPLRRKSRGVGKFHYLRLGYTKPGVKEMTVDLYTPRTMKPRKIDAILRVIAHEFAHHQEPPKVWRRLFKRPILVAHHPRFWKQVKKNVLRLQEDSVLGQYFPTS